MSNHNEEPSVLGGSTGSGLKARPFLTKQESFPIDQNNLAYHSGPVLPPGGDGSPLADKLFGERISWL